MRQALRRYEGHARLVRHRHVHGYAAVVLAGSYVEAGDRGRVRVGAGHVVLHGAYEAHRNEFAGVGAVVLDVPLAGGRADPWTGTVPDPDAVARLAERDLRGAAALLRETVCPVDVRLADWPDLLADVLATEPHARASGVAASDVPLAEWASRLGLAPTSLSRGFRRAYGVSPKRFRLEQRAGRAARALPHWRGSLTDLAADVGFADQAHLTRAVLALTGCTPGRLRSSVQAPVHSPVQSVQDVTPGAG